VFQGQKPSPKPDQSSYAFVLILGRFEDDALFGISPKPLDQEKFHSFLDVIPIDRGSAEVSFVKSC
jgi:hypothetical protein